MDLIGERARNIFATKIFLGAESDATIDFLDFGPTIAELFGFLGGASFILVNGAYIHWVEARGPPGPVFTYPTPNFSMLLVAVLREGPLRHPS